MLHTPKLSRQRPRLGVTVIVALLVAAVIAIAWQSGLGDQMSLLGPQQRDPKSKQPGGPSPSRLMGERTMQKAPVLAGQGGEAKSAVLRFIDWAGKSNMKQREEARQAMARARDNKDIVRSLCQEAFTAQKRDHSRAILILSIIG